MSRRTGELLLERRVVSQEAISEAVALRERTGYRLLSQLWVLGRAKEGDLAPVLADQVGCPVVVLARSSFPLALLDRVSPTIARERRVLPVAETDGALLIAAAEPFNAELIDEVRFHTGKYVIFHGALQAVLERTIAGAYERRGVPDAVDYFGEEADPLRPGHLEIVRPDQPRAVAAADEAVGTLEPGDLIELLLAEDDRVDPVEEAAAPKQTVMVIDDEPSIRQIVAEALEELGVQRIVCSDGQEAIERLQTTLPDLVISDVMLPGVHGFEIARLIKKGDRFRGVPVILMSAAYRGWRVKDDLAETVGVDAYFEKPFPLDVFLRKVEELLGRRTERGGAARAAAQAELARGVAAVKAGDPPAAERHLRAAVVNDPFHLKAHVLLANLYAQQKRTFLAIDHLETVADLDPHNFKTLVALSNLYAANGFRRLAAGALERGLLAAPTEEDRTRLARRLKSLLFPSGG